MSTAEISNLRDFPRPRPTLLQVWIKGGGAEEEEHSSCQADGMRCCLIQATAALLDTQSLMSGAYKGSAIFHFVV